MESHSRSTVHQQRETRTECGARVRRERCEDTTRNPRQLWRATFFFQRTGTMSRRTPSPPVGGMRCVCEDTVQRMTALVVEVADMPDLSPRHWRTMLRHLKCTLNHGEQQHQDHVIILCKFSLLFLVNYVGNSMPKYTIDH